MAEPLIFGTPITTLFLYFIAYSFLGWCVETTYCCIRERRWVFRGFLCGPICPIYGVGALIMVLFFSPLTFDPVLFYLTATVVMSAWEYLVGWFLEATTHIKYWDYSDRRFHIHGRLCLQISLCWGVLSYVTIFLIHPSVVHWFDRIPMWLRYTLSGSLGTLLLVDIITTIRHLALTASLLAQLEQVHEQLQVQTALARAELGDKLETLGGRLEEASLRKREEYQRLSALHDRLLERAEKQSRRFRRRYSHMSAPQFPARLKEVAERGRQIHDTLQARRQQRTSK